PPAAYVVGLFLPGRRQPGGPATRPGRICDSAAGSATVGIFWEVLPDKRAGLRGGDGSPSRTCASRRAADRRRGPSRGPCGRYGLGAPGVVGRRRRGGPRRREGGAA